MTRISYSLLYVSHIMLHVNINQITGLLVTFLLYNDKNIIQLNICKPHVNINQITGLLVTFLLYNDKNIIQLIICKPHYATCKYKSNNRFIGDIPII